MNEAIKKISERLNEQSKAVKGNKETAMQSAVKSALLIFCEQNAEFAQAILQSDKAFADCMKAVANGVGNSISDLDAYRKAVQFYFPGADIKFKMQINLCASVGGDDSDLSMDVSLEDLI